MKNLYHAISMLIVRNSRRTNRLGDDGTLRRCKKIVFTAALLVSLLARPNFVATAQTVTYTDSSAPLQTIVDNGNTNNNSLAPDPANIANNNNTVTVNYSGNNVEFVYGGFSPNGAINHNTVNLVNGTVNSFIYGGSSTTGTASYNIVNISAGTLLGSAYGGISVGGSAANNAINITGNAISVGGGVTGGWSTNADSNNNIVTVSGNNASIAGNVFGGGSGFGNASGNTVIISGNNNAFGSAIFGGEGNTGSASHNRITISGTGTTVSSYVYGGLSGLGATDDNVVSIRDGVFADIVAGGSTAMGSASYNLITIDGGTFSSGVFGGMSSTGTTSYNNIIISGGTVNAVVMGGLTGGSYSIRNVITISGAPDLSTASLYGGFSTGDYFTGNTLNVRSANLSVLSVQNFENYNFYLPASVVNGATILNVTGGLPVDLAGTTVRIVGRAPGGARLYAGDTVILFSSAQHVPATFVGTNINDGLITYNFVPVTSGGAYGVQVSGAQANPQSKALSEGHLVAVTNLNQGQDLLASSGMMSAMNIANDSDTFAAVSAAHNRYATGSELTLNGVSLLAGVGKKHAGPSGTVVTGFFLESGNGNYNTDNSFASGASIRGDGDTNYFGAGYLTRKDGSDGKYVEGSVRGGQVKSTFRSGDLLAATSKSGDYDAKSSYYGMHIGIGRERAVGGNLTLDTYSKFLWTHQNGGSVVTAGGDPVNFEAVNSERWQLGAKLARKVDEHTTVRAGLAYQYEFGAKAGASVYGYSIDAPSLKGGSGLVEFGVSQKHGNAAIDLSLQGVFGKAKGVAGNIQATWKF